MSLKNEVLDKAMAAIRERLTRTDSWDVTCTEAAGIKQNEHYAGLLQVMDDYAVYVASHPTRQGQDLKMVYAR